MSLQINITHRGCWAGSRIPGTVSLHGEKDIDILDLSIRLIGCCDTWSQAHEDEAVKEYRGRAPLFEYQQVLFKGPRTLHPGHSWPFDFIIPMRCVAHGQDSFEDHQGWFNFDPSQALPPSFTDVYPGDRADVSYKLIATLVSGKSGSKPMLAEKVLELNTIRNVERPNPQSVAITKKLKCASPHLRSGRENGPLTFKDRLTSLRTSKLPTAVFDLQMSIPTVGVSGQALPLAMKIELDTATSTFTATPSLFLRTCSVELIAATDMHTSNGVRSWSFPHTLSSIDTNNDERIRHAHVTEVTDLSQLMDTKIPLYHKPSFSTFIVRRGYKIRVRVDVECARKTLKAEFMTGRFRLLSADYLADPGHGDK